MLTLQPRQRLSAHLIQVQLSTNLLRLELLCNKMSCKKPLHNKRCGPSFSTNCLGLELLCNKMSCNKPFYNKPLWLALVTVEPNWDFSHLPCKKWRAGPISRRGTSFGTNF